MNNKYVGFITRHGILHLYENTEDLRKDLTSWKDNRDFSMVAWIDDYIIHPEGDCETEK